MAERGGAPRGLWLFLPGLILLLAAGSLMVLERFDGLYGQDSFAYFDYSTGPLRESLLRLSPPPPAFWPPGYPLLVALASLAIGPIPLAGQTVSLAAGALVPVFTALLAREIGRVGGATGESPGLRVPLVAGLVAACTGQLWQSSTVVMTDTTGLAFATAGAWALARYGRGGSGAWLLLAATLAAYATLTRWIYGLVSVPFALYALTVLARRGRSAAALHGVAAALCAGLILLPVLLPALAPVREAGGGATPFAGSFEIFSWDPRRAFGREFVTTDGLLRHDWPNALYYGLAPARWAYFTPLLAPFVLPGLWAVLRRRSPASLLLICGWTAIVLAFLVGTPFQNFRYTLAFLPPLAVLVGIGVDRLLRLAPGALARPAPIYLAASLAVMALAGAHTTRSLFERKNASLSTVRWAEGRIAPDARLLTFGLTLSFHHYSPLEVLELFLLDPTQMGTILSTDRPTYLLVDVGNLESQWAEHSPGRNFRWLDGERGLVEVGSHREYTLFRVGAEPRPSAALPPERYTARTGRDR